MPTLVKQQFFGGHFAMMLSHLDKASILERMQCGYVANVLIDESESRMTPTKTIDVNHTTFQNLLKKPMSLFLMFERTFNTYHDFLRCHSFTELSQEEFDTMKKHAVKSYDSYYFGAFSEFEYGECVRCVD